MPFRVDRSPKAASKLPPMYSPRIDGGGVLASRVIPPSPLSKGLDGPIGSIASPSVDYDDVFGGPPRFATSTFATPDSQGHATLDRAVGRAPSFRSPALPVFELPVFGDEPLGGSNTYEPRPASVTYDDIFREELHVPDVYQGSATYGNLPRSRASSRSTSRRMSPLHPAASLTDQLLHEEICAAANSGVFSKSRSTVGKVEGRNSFSSPVYDDTRSKPLDPIFMVARNESVGSSLPASPPHNTTWGHVKRFTASKSVHNLEEAPANVEVDDVFGGFPRRTYPSVFQGVNHDFPRSPKLRNAITKGTAESDAPRSPQIPKSSEPYGGLTRTLSSSSSSDGEKELQDDFIEIRMDKQNDAAVAKKAETGASRTFVTVSDLRQSAQLTSTKVSARPPPAPAPTPPSATGGVIKQKSWKDWTLNTEDSPSVNSYSSRVTQDSSMAFGTNSTVKNELDNGTLRTQQNKSGVESFGLKHLESNSSSTQSPRGKFKIFSPLRTALRAKPPVVDTMQLEERQLHTMLNNAWKNNEQREEKKNSATRLSENSPSVTASLKQDHSMKGGKKKPSKPLETPLNQQMFPKTEQKQADLRWKSWKKPHSKEKFNEKDSNKVGSEIESKQMKAPGHVVHDITEERADNGEKCNLSSECEDSFDPEEFVKVVTEELSANGPKQEVDQRNFETKSSTKRAEDSEIIGNEKPAPCEMDINKVASARTSRNGSFQDFGEYSEQQEVIFSEGLEEYDCLTGLDALQLGFQDIDGESVERRKARWVRHLRAKERAAKALEEMQQRDAEVLREQAEKQQLAENADRQIKRWATGKEGNLRALLSNLQHVLWSESGWKPISLTDLIEGPDVKKAYRKATLFVHPDKLQQKGATLQQKYIAERVFDILQEAWKTFNLQELF